MNATQTITPAPPRVSAPKPYFPVLNGMRGIAALFVVAFHLNPYMGTLTVPMGYAAVDLFFLLSGVVIEANYGERLRAGTPILYFARIRAIRLYPLYILGSVIMVAAAVIAPQGVHFMPGPMYFSIQHPLALLTLAAFFVPVYSHAFMFPLDPPAWSLFWEIVINLVYAVLLPFLGRRMLLILVGSSFCVFIAGTLQGTSVAGVPWLDMARVSFSFFLGVLMYRERTSRIVPAWKSVALICAALGCQHDTPLVYLTIATVVFPVAVWQAIHAAPAGRIWDFLGDISYPVYAIHVPLFVLFLAVAGSQPQTISTGIPFIAALMGIAVALNRFYDAPIRKMLSR